MGSEDRRVRRIGASSALGLGASIRNKSNIFPIYLAVFIARSRAVSRDPADRYQSRPNSSPVA